MRHVFRELGVLIESSPRGLRVESDDSLWYFVKAAAVFSLFRR